MDKEDLFTDDFLKSFKSGEEFQSFMKQLHRRGMEKLLEGELDAHLDYQKHKPRTGTNSRNGYGTKQLITDYGEDTIRVPRDREASFEPMLNQIHPRH